VFDTVGVTALIAGGALAGWLAARAWRARHPLAKWSGVTVAGLVSVACTALLCIALLGFYRINFPSRRPPASEMRVAATPELLERGARFGAFCAQCHGQNNELPLVGSNLLGEGAPPAGTIYAANLTGAGEINGWSDAEILRAIREGIHKNGRALIIMPSEIFRRLSDDDAHAIIAYLRSLPPTGADTPPTRLNVIGALFVGAGLVRTAAQDPIAQPIVAPPRGATPEYGKYLVSVLGCQLCHGEQLTGGKAGGPGPPPGPSLRAIIPKWSAEDFARTLRTGIDPYKHTLNEGMPWKALSNFATDEDLMAMYVYLTAQDSGVRSRGSETADRSADP